MAGYVPVLKGRAGEFSALARTGQRVVGQGGVVLEVPAGGAPREDARRFVAAAKRALPHGLTVAVDAAAVTGRADEAMLGWIGREFAEWQLPLRPVFRIEDPPQLLAQVQGVAGLHQRGACLRVGAPVAAPHPDTAERALPAVLTAVKLNPDQIDLLIDLWALGSERDVGRAVPLAVAMLEWAASRPWRSVALAAGGFPEQITNLPKHTATPLPRWEAMLWRQVSAYRPAVLPDFADFGVTHPQNVPAVPRPALPNIRYAAGSDWQVYRWPKADDKSYATVYDLCEELTGSSHWPSEGGGHCWGDQQIARRASGIGGPGAGREWRAWATSHHLVEVTARLATLGEP